MWWFLGVTRFECYTSECGRARVTRTFDEHRKLSRWCCRVCF